MKEETASAFQRKPKIRSQPSVSDFPTPKSEALLEEQPEKQALSPWDQSLWNAHGWSQIWEEMGWPPSF